MSELKEISQVDRIKEYLQKRMEDAFNNYAFCVEHNFNLEKQMWDERQKLYRQILFEINHGELK